MSSRFLGAAALWAILPAFGSAQFVIRPAGEGGIKLTLRTMKAEARVWRGFAQVTMTYTFANPITRRTEADFLYKLPEGSLPTGFAYWKGEERVQAYTSEKERARAIYQGITTTQQDPALIEMVDKRTIRVKVFPVMPLEDLQVEVKWIVPLSRGPQSETLSLPLKMKKGKLEKLSVHVWMGPDPDVSKVHNSQAVPVQTGKDGSIISYEGAQTRPDKDLTITLSYPDASPRARVWSAFSGGPTGFFAASLPKSSGTPSLPGGFDLRSKNIPGGRLVVGRYKTAGPATLKVGSRSFPILLEDRREPGHIGLKLWTALEIARLDQTSAGRKKAVALAVSQGLLSKESSWIAIPTDERQRFAALIAEARARLILSEIGDALRKSSRIPEKLLAEFRAECAKGKINERDLLQETLQDLAYEMESSALDLARSGRISKARNILQRRAALVKRFAVEETDYSMIDSERSDILRRIVAARAGLLSGSSGLGRDRRTLQLLQAVDPIDLRRETLEAEQEVFATRMNYLQSQVLNGRITPKRAADQVKALSRILRPPLEKDLLDYSVSSVFAREAAGMPEPGDQERLARWREFRRLAPYGPGEKAVVRQGVRYVLPLWRETFESEGSRGPLIENLRTCLDLLDKKERPSAVKEVIQLSQDAAVKRVGPSLFEGKIERAQAVEAVRDRILKSLLPAGLSKEEILEHANEEASIQTNIRGEWSSLRWKVHEEEWPIGTSRSGYREAKARLDQFVSRFRSDLQQDLASESWWVDARIAYIRALRSGTPTGAELENLKRQALAQTANTRPPAYQEDRANVLLRSIELERLLDRDRTPEQEKKLAALEEEITRLRARMGDPLLSVRLPAMTLAASVTFPWGETAPLTFNPAKGLWERRFDIPPSAGEGMKAAVIVAHLPSGQVHLESETFQVDLTPPTLKVQPGENRLEVRDLSGDVARIRAFPLGGEPVDLIPADENRWVSPTPLPTRGTRIVATDRAHNRTELGTPAPAPVPVLARPAETVERRFANLNIQAIAVWGDRLVAGALDEGLWIAEGGQEREVRGLPSTAPRTLLPCGKDLVVRFGTGDLILLHPDLTWTSLRPNLPRKDALAVSVHKGKIAVAQPGMISILGKSGWQHWNCEEAWKGGPVSALLLTDDRLWVGIQGKGVLETPLLDGGPQFDASTWHDERGGLSDDWITALLKGPDGMVMGSFVGGAIEESGHAWSPIRATSGSHATSLLDGQGGTWIGTRTGLFHSRRGTVTRWVWTEVEIQGLAPAQDGLWAATRKGAFRLKTAE